MKISDIMSERIYAIEKRLPVKIRKSNSEYNYQSLNTNENNNSNVNNISFKNILEDKLSINKYVKNNGLDNTSSVGDLEDMVSNYIGTPYVWGGTTTKGFDCSGFTQYIMDKLGVDINRTSKEQAKNGDYVQKKDLQKGDLVFFNTTGKGISHVGIYLEDGKFVHASSGAKKVTISDLNNGYYNEKYVEARRVV